MKKLFTLIAALLMLSASAAELTVFDGTVVNDKVPINATFIDWGPYTHQVIYPAAQVADLVGKEITSVKYYVANDEGNTLNNGMVSLYIGTTESNDFSGWTVSYVSEELLTKVATITTVTGVSEIEFIFDNAWTYNGGNIVIETLIEEDSNGSVAGSTATEFLGQTVTKASAYGQTTVTAADFAPKTTFTYEGGGEEPGDGVTTLGQANALEDNAAFTFNGDAVVTYCLTGNNNIVYLFLRDESGYGMIANVDATFESGKVLSQGWNATKTSVNNGWVRFTNAENLNASNETNADLAAAQVLTAFPDESMLNAYVVIEKTTISSGGGGGFPGLPGHAVKYSLPDGSTIGETQTLWSFDGEAGDDLYNVYGIVCKVSGAFKIQPVKFEKYVEPQGLRGDVDDNGTVDVLDATALINYLLYGDSTGINLDNANCDLEEGVDITDATALINFLLYDTWNN